MIYVSTKLNIRQFDSLWPFPADDIVWYGEIYRRLTPEYYAWLRRRYVLARKKNLDGIIPDDQFKLLRSRFTCVLWWVIMSWQGYNLCYSLSPNYRPPRIADDGLPESLNRKGLKWYG